MRDRFVIVSGTIGFFFALCWYFIDFLLLWLEDPLPERFKHLTFISPAEPFFTTMHVALMGSLFISMPVILYHAWEFIAPGLKVKEKKITLLFVLFGTAFFLIGGAFCYFLILPLGLNFLLLFGTNYWKMEVTIGLYLDFVVKLILAFAFAFQTPLIMVLLTKFGVINTVKMRLYRKWAFLGAFIVAAVLTPPDVVTQTSLALPLYGLYEFGVVASMLVEDPKRRAEVIQEIMAEREARKAKKAAADAAAEAAAKKFKQAPKKDPGKETKKSA
ncbi:MAG: twin-arginine translocase subunit TatC [Nitrospinae bacterium]|nr:twin-arginine translocase subunit TatC [Nitrospinota bacterium]